MIKNYIVAIACCLPLGVIAQNGFTVRGKVGTLEAPATAYLSYTSDGVKIKDSAILEKGQFTFKGKLSSPASADLIIKHDTITRGKFATQDYLQFYLENSIITITSPDSVRRAIIKGSTTGEDEKKLRAWQRPYKRIADSITAVYWKLTPEQRKDTNWTNAIRPLMQMSQAGYDSVSKAFIAQYPKSYISLLTFKQSELGYNFNPDTAAAKFARFPASQRESYMGKQLQEMIETGKKTNTGVLAMDFTEYDTTGKPVKLSDFRGQYVLVDFWASWCKPCRAENPNMLKAYKKYKGKNFNIIGVSLDDDNGRRAWLGAVKQDSLPWPQVSELKGFKGKSAVLYGVQAIPTNFLIDPSGKIIARNLRGEDLEKKLKELFNI